METSHGTQAKAQFVSMTEALSLGRRTWSLLLANRLRSELVPAQEEVGIRSQMSERHLWYSL